MADFLDVAITAARVAGEIQRAGLRRPVAVRVATAHDVKLQTDVDCEEAIRGILRSAFPDHAILGEEEGGSIDADVPTWIVDPLDGTVNYSRRHPHFCVSIALQVEGRSIVGAVYNPITDELFTAREGQGAFLNGERITVSAVSELRDAMVAIGCGKCDTTVEGTLNAVRELIHTTQKIRILGAAALEMSYIACGRLDGFIEDGLRTWDIAAGDILIREAGGRVQLTAAGEYTWNIRADNGRIL